MTLLMFRLLDDPSVRFRALLLDDPVTLPATITKTLKLLQSQCAFPADGTGEILLVAYLHAGPLVNLLDQFLVVVTSEGKNRHYFRLRKAQPTVSSGIIGRQGTYTSHTVCIADAISVAVAVRCSRELVPVEVKISIDYRANQ